MEYLARQQRQQVEVYGVDPGALLGEERARYLRENAYAAIREITEYVDNFEWKPWHRGVAGQPIPGTSMVARQDNAEELCDVLKFVFNLALLERLTDPEVEDTFEYKARKNAERHRGARA